LAGQKEISIVVGDDKMSHQTSTDLMTVTLRGTDAFIRPGGRAAIRLDTIELGPIAFELDHQTIELIRQTLTTAETFLRQRERHL
jgi:hypothetical protein